MGAQSLWIEEVDSESDAEINYEINYLKSFFKSNLTTKVYRLFFVLEKVPKHNKVDIKKLTFLSCSTIVNYSALNKSNSYLLFSVIAIPKKYYFKNKSIPLMNYYFHSAKDYKFSFSEPKSEKVDFIIHGAPFFQKNDATSFCIQSALATILNNMIYRDKLILPNRINDILGLSVEESGAGGMDIDQTLDVIRRVGLNEKTFDFSLPDTEKLFKKLNKYYDWPPASILYPWMESGFPGFIIFYTRANNLHVVPIIGHTLNTDVWQPEADIQYNREVKFHFRSVSAWVDNFIIHDDNFGMYLCYPTEKLGEKKRGQGYLVNYVLFLTENKIKYPPDKIEINLIRSVRSIFEKIRDVSEEENNWIYRMVNELKAPLVSRTLSVRKEEYIEVLRKPDSEKNMITEDISNKVTKKLPDSFWLTEITLPDLYIANKSALISIASTLDAGEIIFMRFPRFCFFINKAGQFETIDLPTGSHYEIFQRKHDIETYDW